MYTPVNLSLTIYKWGKGGQHYIVMFSWCELLYCTSSPFWKVVYSIKNEFATSLGQQIHFWEHIPSGHMTFIQRRLNVDARWGDVVLTSCACWTVSLYRPFFKRGQHIVPEMVYPSDTQRLNNVESTLIHYQVCPLGKFSFRQYIFIYL